MKQISVTNEEIAIIKEGLIMYKRVLLQEKSQITQGGQALSIASKLVEERLITIETLEKKVYNDYQTYTSTR